MSAMNYDECLDKRVDSLVEKIQAGLVINGGSCTISNLTEAEVLLTRQRLEELGFKNVDTGMGYGRFSCVISVWF